MLLAGILALGWWVLVFEGATSAEALVALVTEPIDSLGRLRFPVVLALATLGFLAFVPQPVVFGACGLVLGTVGGFPVSILALGTAVAIECWVASTLLGDWLRRRVPRLDERLTAFGLGGVVLARLAGTPHPAIAWGSTATQLRARTVTLGCMIGTIPRGLAYVALGASGAALWPPSAWTWQVVASVVLLVLAAAATVVLVLRSRRLTGRDGDTGGATE